MNTLAAQADVRYFDTRGHPFRVSRMVGQGGEAAVYRLVEQPQLLAKIYTRLRPEYEKKLTWMRDHPPDDPARELNHASIAWPQELLYGPERNFAGYIMPRIHNAVGLLSVFNPRLRALTLPQFNEIYLHRTARNLASAVGALHDRDYVVGDLNESNVMVTPATLVTMIDTDSFQVRARNWLGREVIYKCPVGKYEYLPPELQGRALDDAREPAHDRFSLAVLIFQLLMDGNHPFRARWLGQGDPPPIEARIKAGWYPHAISAPGSRDGDSRPPVEPPHNMLHLAVLHPHLVALLERCFVRGHRNPAARPTPEEWEAAFAQAEKSLRPCGHGHYYSDHLLSCPKCLRHEVLTRSGARDRRARMDEAITALLDESFRPGQLTFRPKKKTAAAPSSPLPRPRPQPAYRLADQAGDLVIFERVAYVLAGLASGPLGTILLVAALGSIFAGILVAWLGVELGGPITGGLAGLANGLFLSEWIDKKWGWGPSLGISGAAASGLWLWTSGLGPFYTLGAAMLAGLTGWLLGNLLPRYGWQLLLIGLSTYLGGWLGMEISQMAGADWSRAAMAGAALWAAAGGSFALWRRL